MNRVVFSGLTVVFILAAGAIAYGLAAQILPIRADNQIQMQQIPNSYDGRLGYVSILNAAMPTQQGAELDSVLPDISVDSDAVVEEVPAISQLKASTQTHLALSHGKNCRVE